MHGEAGDLLGHTVIECQLLRLDRRICRNREDILYLPWLSVGTSQSSIDGLRTIPPEEERAAGSGLEFSDFRSFKVLNLIDNDEVCGRASVPPPLMVVHEVVSVQTNRADAV